jgi:hypothetical protein
MWAMSVVNGKGDEYDSLEYALWMLREIGENGVTENIRRNAWDCLARMAVNRAAFGH